MAAACVVCGDPLARTAYHGREVLYCGRRCKSKAFNAARVADGRLREQRLAQQDRIRAYAKTKPRRQHYPESTQAADARRRARKAGVEVERFTHREIFDRDGWRCGICGGDVDPAIRYPELLSASLDHAVPIAEGGPHTRANVQLAHLGCNLSKGSRSSEAA